MDKQANLAKSLKGALKRYRESSKSMLAKKNCRSGACAISNKLDERNVPHKIIAQPYPGVHFMVETPKGTRAHYTTGKRRHTESPGFEAIPAKFTPRVQIDNSGVQVKGKRLHELAMKLLGTEKRANAVSSYAKHLVKQQRKLNPKALKGNRHNVQAEARAKSIDLFKQREKELTEKLMLEMQQGGGGPDLLRRMDAAKATALNNNVRSVDPTSFFRVTHESPFSPAATSNPGFRLPSSTSPLSRNTSRWLWGSPTPWGAKELPRDVSYGNNIWHKKLDKIPTWRAPERTPLSVIDPFNTSIFSAPDRTIFDMFVKPILEATDQANAAGLAIAQAKKIKDVVGLDLSSGFFKKLKSKLSDLPLKNVDPNRSSLGETVIRRAQHPENTFEKITEVVTPQGSVFKNPEGKIRAYSPLAVDNLDFYRK